MSTARGLLHPASFLDPCSPTPAPLQPGHPRPRVPGPGYSLIPPAPRRPLPPDRDLDPDRDPALALRDASRPPSCPRAAGSVGSTAWSTSARHAAPGDVLGPARTAPPEAVLGAPPACYAGLRLKQQLRPPEKKERANSLFISLPPLSPLHTHTS